MRITTYLAIMFFGFACSNSKNIVGSVLPEPFKLRFETIANKRNNKVSTDELQAFLKIDTVQRLSEKGLRFAIEVVNSSTADVSISNILDRLKIQLINESGSDVIVPHFPKELINAGPNNSVMHRSVKVEAVRIQGKEVDINVLKEALTTVPAQGTFEVSLQVTTVMDLAAMKSSNVLLSMTLSAGKYLFGAMILFSRDSKSETRSTDPITVSYH